MIPPGTVDWAAVLGGLNLACLVGIVGLILTLQRKQVDALRAEIDSLRTVRQSDFVREVQSFRAFYEEKSIMIEEQLARAGRRAQEAERELAGVVRALGLRPESEADLIAEISRLQPGVSLNAVSNLLHDVRTPLTAMLGFTELIIEGDDPETTREHAVYVKSAGVRLLNSLGSFVDLMYSQAPERRGRSGEHRGGA